MKSPLSDATTRRKRVLRQFRGGGVEGARLDGQFQSRLLTTDVQRRLAYYPRALQAARYVRQNLARHIRLEDVAAHVGMSNCAFSRYFATKIGITLFYLVKILRIEHALIELERSDRAISELATRTGYQSCCSFSKAFKDVTGCSPSEYRREAHDGTLAEHDTRAR